MSKRGKKIWVAVAIAFPVVIVALFIATQLFPMHGRINHGEITNKWYEPYEEHHWLMPIYITHCSGGKYNTCYTSIAGFIPMTDIDDEDYMVTVKTCQYVNSLLIHNQYQCWSEDWKLTEDNWKRTNIGDEVDRLTLVGAVKS